MSSGKDALINKQYDIAIENFELAIIEKPNDEDANSLLDKSKRLANIEENLTVYNDFIDDTSDIFMKIKELSSDIDYENEGKTTKSEASKKLDSAYELDEKLNVLNGKWAIIDEYSTAIDLLTSSNDYLIYALDTIINDDGSFDPKNYESRFDAVRENPLTDVNYGINNCRESLLEYNKKIDKIKSEIDNG